MPGQIGLLEGVFWGWPEEKVEKWVFLGGVSKDKFEARKSWI